MWLWDFLSREGFQPHGLCLLWRPDVFWAHVLSDAAIAAAYFSIPIALMYLALRRKDLIHRWVLVLFSSFIVACGITHLFGIWTMWVPSYGVEALAKMVTAAVSLSTAIMLWPLMPTLLAMPSSQQLAIQNKRLEEEVAERRAAQADLKTLNDQLERRVAARTASLTRANKELREAREIADRSNRAKSDFLATMSHEIRTPMNGVLGTIELLKSHRGPEEQGRLLEVAKNSADCLLAIIDDILDYSKLEAGAVTIARTPFSPGRIVEQVGTLLREGAEQKGLCVDVALSPGLPETVVGDGARLRQVLFNLAGNAIKFTDGGSVRLSVMERSCEGEAVEFLFSVADTGIGIAKEAQTRIFDRFAQVDATTYERFGGTGLGLAICRQLVALMGGTIGVESIEGLGSTFWFTIRCAPAPHVISPHRGADIPPPARPLEILLAEDNPVNRMIIESFLRAQGHAVTTVGTGEEAVSRCVAAPFDVVLMDVYMPRMDGLEATRRLKGMGGRASSIPIIALTASVMPDDIEAYRRVGMWGHVAKPVDQATLFAALYSATSQSEHRPVVGADTQEPRPAVA